MLLKNIQTLSVNMPNTLNMTELWSTTWLSKHGAAQWDWCIDPNVKTFYAPGDLKNKVKVKLATCNKRSCHYAFWMQISSLHLK